MSAHGPGDKRAFASATEEVLTRHYRDLTNFQASALVGLIVTARRVARSAETGVMPSPEDVEALAIALARVEEA